MAVDSFNKQQILVYLSAIESQTRTLTKSDGASVDPEQPMGLPGGLHRVGYGAERVTQCQPVVSIHTSHAVVIAHGGGSALISSGKHRNHVIFSLCAINGGDTNEYSGSFGSVVRSQILYEFVQVRKVRQPNQPNTKTAHVIHVN